LSILEGPFRSQHVEIAGKMPSLDEAELLMARWEAYSLVNFLAASDDGMIVWYEIPTLVRKYMLRECSPEKLRELHKTATEVIERDLVTLAVLHAAEKGTQLPTNQDDYTIARRELRRIVDEEDSGFSAVVVRRVLDWRRHFLALGEYDRAFDIVKDTWNRIAYKFAEPDLARKMLEESTETATGKNQLLARTYLADFYAQDGNFDEAMKVYKKSAEAFMKAKDEPNAADAIASQADILNRQGKFEQAIKTAEQARQIWKKLNKPVSEAIVLTQICNYYIYSKKYQEAYAVADQAHKILEKYQSWEDLMRIIHSKGIIFKNLKQYD
jgi:hypothetical protein